MENYEIFHRGMPLKQASKALILLHGRGGTAHDIMSLADALGTDHFYIAAPQAPNKAWYPSSFMVEEKLNEPYLSSAIENIKNLIDETAQHIPKDQIYLMGFSQGACLALEISSRFATKYGGIVAFSGGLIGSTVNEKKYQGNFQKTKVFIGLSEQDPYIPLERAKQSKELMDKRSANVTLKVYPGTDHTINADEIAWVRKNILSFD